MAASWRFQTFRGFEIVSIVRFKARDIPTWVRTTNPNTLMHANWWTAMPALPSSNSAEGYRRLWRQFADHTMNTWVDNPDGTTKPGSRGFYIEKREDHLVPAFFENFALFLDGLWLQQICAISGIRTSGPITKLAWSYSYEEVLVGERRPRIADVTIMWRDDLGEAVAVIEAKKPGYSFTSLSQKDHPESGYYLNYSAMSGIERRHQLLLIDENDRRHLNKNGLSISVSVITWQHLAKIALDLALELPIKEKKVDLVCARLKAHYGALGLLPEQRDVDATGDAESYAYFQSFDIPQRLIDWLVGSELFFATRKRGAIVRTPYEWFESEYSAADWKLRKLQTTAERCQPTWRLR